MSKLIITIPGQPIAKKRPRFARRGTFVTTYNSQQTEEGKFICLMQNQFYGPPIPAGVPVFLTIYFHVNIPKSLPKKRLAIGPVRKPDIDNMIKFVMDCANGIFWHDDAQVVHVEATKIYDANPKTIIGLEWGW